MPETRKTFHQHLDEIKSDLLRLGAMVTERIPWGTDILLSGNLKGAEELIKGDDELDALYWDIEERCYKVLTLQQPMAGDMRAIVTAIRMNSEIERSGDLMVNIAKAARRIYGSDFDPKVRGLIQRMSEEAQRLNQMAMDSYAENDEGKAAALNDIDDGLDGLHADYIKAIFETAGDAEKADLRCLVQLALVGRYYERIGDHAVNVGERVHYMITGWLPEHAGAARVEVRNRLDQAGADADHEVAG
jgi:phosphate transport system protein